MKDTGLDFTQLQDQLRSFARERDWEKFHLPKNLVMALAGEVGELTELFQWLTPEESRQVMSSEKSAEQVRDEVADVMVYCLRICDVLKIDPYDAIQAKMKKNAAKYPVHLAKGSAAKYTEYNET
jgi:NTP pyrophosphatase (non-canonical NTP hydrolase)